ncbi:DUF1190 domain-containing protein [Roseibium sediminis]|uniref:DUF1190 domain-containing protein n=1 Tax=Roseibium sediminis TaxID=1775174 RepID=UPI0013763920|nr:DUF1190 domain-containing protein [Roseibium sediminis]
MSGPDIQRQCGSRSDPLAGCSQEPNVEGRVYKSEAECVSDTYLEDGSCSDVFEIGQKVHQESGPRYESMSLCLDQHGNQCTETPAPGYSYFTPLAGHPQKPRAVG